jgi:hypothetical protein
MSKTTDQQEEDLKPVLDKDEQKEIFMNWLKAIPNPNIGWPTTRLHLGTWRFARQSPPVVWRRSCDANDMFQMKKMSGCWVALAFTQRKIDVW